MVERTTYREGKFTGWIVHSTAEHERKAVSDDFRSQDFLIVDWTFASVGQGCSHDWQSLTVNFQRTGLYKKILELKSMKKPDRLNLEVHVQATLDVVTRREAVVFHHVVGKGKVPMSCCTLWHEDCIAESNMLSSSNSLRCAFWVFCENAIIVNLPWSTSARIQTSHGCRCQEQPELYGRQISWWPQSWAWDCEACL